VLENITLKDYVNAIGKAKLAEQLGITEEAIYYWTRYINAPRPHVAFRLIQISNGLLTWEKIYQPFVDNNVESQTSFDFSSNK
jgi:hypothetical protein